MRKYRSRYSLRDCCFLMVLWSIIKPCLLGIRVSIFREMNPMIKLVGITHITGPFVRLQIGDIYWVIFLYRGNWDVWVKLWIKVWRHFLDG